MTPPRYLSRGDYLAKVSKYEEARRKRAEAWRSNPQVWSDDHGWNHAGYAQHPDGINGPQLPEPWHWNGELWTCWVEFREIEKALETARRIFGIGE